MILKRQVIRSGTSVGVNYREAGDALGPKDFVRRLKIARKEAKETAYWLELIQEENPKLAPQMKKFLQESIELSKILSAMINTAKKKNTE